MLALVISTIFTSSSPRRRFSSAQAAMISSKLLDRSSARRRRRTRCRSAAATPAACRGTSPCRRCRRDATKSSMSPSSRQQRVDLDEPRLALPRAIDLAVDAVEVAHLVGVEIHPDRHPPRPPAEHRVDEAVGFERSLVQRCGVGGWSWECSTCDTQGTIEVRGRTLHHRAGPLGATRPR